MSELDIQLARIVQIKGLLLGVNLPSKRLARQFRGHSPNTCTPCSPPPPRYRAALEVVDDPTPAIRELGRITQRRRTSAGQSVRAFNPLAREDRQLFEALSSGEHHIRGFANQDLCAKLLESQILKTAAQNAQQLAGKVSRLLRRLHLYGLIAKVPHARRWRVTKMRLRILSSAMRLRDYTFPQLHAAACG